MTRLLARKVPERRRWQLEQQGLHPLLARLYAARGISDRSQLDYDLKKLLPPATLTHAEAAAELLADAIDAGARILIVGDYDCDGATATAVGVRALRAFCAGTEARVDYLVPNRFAYGYGLSPEIVALAAQQSPDLLVTVDNGIASVEGVAAAAELGIATLITDHHLPGETLPAADCIVNPNQPGCAFESKAIAGVGVMFYVMLALRAELRRRGHFEGGRAEPNLGALLDLVALGTVADVVALDHNNRILVAQGLKRMREGKLQAGIRALFRACGRQASQASAFDLGFLLGPRINAAGRLADMSVGVECLITDDDGRAMNLAQELDRLNRERREIETDMQDQALRHLEALDTSAATETNVAGIALFDVDWHQGVVGIVASRLKERLHRPVFAFARADAEGGAGGDLRGSGRSIPGLHLRDALDLVSKRAPGLLKRFGGHAAAAGVTIAESDFPRFAELFGSIAGELLAPADLTRTLETDGPLETAYCSLEIARLLAGEVWGQGFAAPVFEDRFEVEQQRLLKDRHLKLKLRRDRSRIDAIRFNVEEHLKGGIGKEVRAAYRLDINEYQGIETTQLLIEHLENI
jgi:single-stranded-DNA-specific exonuclease